MISEVWVEILTKLEKSQKMGRAETSQTWAV